MDKIVATLGLSGWWYALVMLAVVVFGAAWIYHEAVLKEPGHDRDKLLARLEKGGDPRVLYVAWISDFLDWADGKIGDAGQAQRWVARVLGTRWPSPYWTGRSFDTCALLAVVYPLASMVLIWARYGDAGPLGTVFGLAADVS